VRAQRIARTEVLTANRRGGLRIAQDAGAQKKQWMANVGSNRTRAWHKKANGQIVSIDQPFVVRNCQGAEQKLMIPGDYSMGATGDNTINCRCAVRYIKPEVTQPPASTNTGRRRRPRRRPDRRHSRLEPFTRAHSTTHQGPGGPFLF